MIRTMQKPITGAGTRTPPTITRTALRVIFVPVRNHASWLAAAIEDIVEDVGGDGACSFLNNLE